MSVYVDQLGEHPFTGTLYNYLGNDCLALDDFDKAVEYLSRASSIRKDFFNQETARTLHSLGEAYKMKASLRYVNILKLFTQKPVYAVDASAENSEDEREKNT